MYQFAHIFQMDMQNVSIFLVTGLESDVHLRNKVHFNEISVKFQMQMRFILALKRPSTIILLEFTFCYGAAM